jgi:hypothetical protein
MMKGSHSVECDPFTILLLLLETRGMTLSPALIPEF